MFDKMILALNNALGYVIVNYPHPLFAVQLINFQMRYQEFFNIEFCEETCDFYIADMR